MREAILFIMLMCCGVVYPQHVEHIKEKHFEGYIFSKECSLCGLPPGDNRFTPSVEPKSVIRISRCCMAERNPLVFPISRGRIVVFSTTWPSTECACFLSFPDMRVLISVRSGLS